MLVLNDTISFKKVEAKDDFNYSYMPHAACLCFSTVRLHCKNSWPFPLSYRISRIETQSKNREDLIAKGPTKPAGFFNKHLKLCSRKHLNGWRFNVGIFSASVLGFFPRFSGCSSSSSSRSRSKSKSKSRSRSRSSSSSSSR